ncbi:MAG TPA: heparin lyase I family protein [Hyphomicrobium sp.]|nr:heparin lyase I family protein [Hyphomicrobium sp.]
MRALSALLACWMVGSGAANAQEFRVDGRIANRHAADVPYAITTPFPGQFRFEVRPGDQWSVDRKSGTGAERAELSLDKDPVRIDVRYRVSYEIGIEQGAPADSTWLVLGQWHATEDKGDAPSSPPLAFELSGDDLVIYTQATSEPRHTKNPPPVERARVPGIARDRWYRIEYDVLFNPSHGDLAVRIDGQPVFAGEIPIGYADAVGPYFKFGIYRSKSAERFAVRFRNILIGVLPR